MIVEPWSEPLVLAELVRSARSATLTPDEAIRQRIAKTLNLVELAEFTADLALKPWFDGVEITGRWRARYTQTCGITLEAFETRQEEDVLIRCVPPGSRALPADPEGEVVLDPEADDPPDVIEGGVVDLGHYLVEQFVLALDPFPRKPGAVFEPPEETKPLSPFAVLAQLKPRTE